MATKEQVCRVNWDEDNVGKNVKSSKKRVTWNFYIEDDQYAVVLVHSRVSGKKTLYLNNEIKIETAKNTMGDWSTTLPVPGFPCPKGKAQHLCRVLIKDATKTQSGESSYEFFVDNITFTDLPSKRMREVRGMDNSRSQTSVSSKRWGVQGNETSYAAHTVSAPSPAPAPAPPPQDLLGDFDFPSSDPQAANVVSPSFQSSFFEDEHPGSGSAAQQAPQSVGTPAFDPFSMGGSAATATAPSPAPATRFAPPSTRTVGGPVDILGGVGGDSNPLMDLAGLSFEPVEVQAPVEAPEQATMFEPFQDSSAATTDTAVPEEEMGKNTFQLGTDLVNLDDLTGTKKKAAPKQYGMPRNKNQTQHRPHNGAPEAKVPVMRTPQPQSIGISTMGMGQHPQMGMGMGMGMPGMMPQGMGHMQQQQQQQQMGMMGQPVTRGAAIGMMGMGQQPRMGLGQAQMGMNRPHMGMGMGQPQSMSNPQQMPGSMPMPPQQGNGVQFDPFIGLR